jgi:hypothetical protein
LTRFGHILASQPYEATLILLLGCCVAISITTLSRARRVHRAVHARAAEPAAELWSRTQVRIEWCILAAQVAVFALTIHRMGATIWDDNRSSFTFHVYGTIRVLVSCVLSWCVLMNKRTCEQLQLMPTPSESN